MLLPTMAWVGLHLDRYDSVFLSMNFVEPSMLSHDAKKTAWAIKGAVLRAQRVVTNTALAVKVGYLVAMLDRRLYYPDAALSKFSCGGVESLQTLTLAYVAEKVD